MAVRGCVGLSQSLRLAVGGHRSRNRDFVGKFSADLFDGGPDLDRDAALAKLGGSIFARLIVVSNRVAVPSRDGGNLAGGLAVAVRSLLKRHEGLWFGWSGTVSSDEDIATKTVQHGGMSYAVTDLVEADYQEYYNGFANRVLADSPLPPRPRGVFTPRSQRLPARQRAFCESAEQISAARRRHLGARLSSHSPCKNAARAWSPQPYRILPARSVSSARHPHRLAEPRLAHSAIERLRSDRLADRERCDEFQALSRK